MDEITLIVGRVEARKQIKPLTTAQRVELIDLLFGLNESVESIMRRAESVMLTETYGTIAYQYWVGDLIGSRREIDRELSRMRRTEQARQREYETNLNLEIDKRLKKYRDGQTTNPKIAELAGEQEALKKHENTLNEIRERSRQQTTRKIRFARQVLTVMDKETRRTVLDEAVKRGLMKGYDDAVVQNIQMFADKLYPVTSQLHQVAA